MELNCLFWSFLINQIVNYTGVFVEKKQSLFFHKVATMKCFAVGICIIVSLCQDKFQDSVSMDICIGLFIYCKMEHVFDRLSVNHASAVIWLQKLDAEAPALPQSFLLSKHPVSCHSVCLAKITVCVRHHGLWLTVPTKSIRHSPYGYDGNNKVTFLLLTFTCFYYYYLFIYF